MKSKSIAIIALLVIGVAIVALVPHNEFVSSHAVSVGDGQVMDLANFPQNLILPNGAELKNVGNQTLSGVEIISAEYVSNETYSPIKLTWLDSGRNKVGYSSHTVLNKPSYYGFYDGASGIVKIWPHLGAKKVKVEIWKE